MNEKMKNLLPLILSGLSLIGVIILFCLCFCGDKNCCTTTNSPKTAIAPVSTSETTSELRIAYVNTDSILEGYALVQESEKALENLYKAKEKQLQSAQTQFEADYNAYLQVGASMTLQQQQDKEEELNQRRLKLYQMDEQFTMEIRTMSQEKNKITADSVINFISRYNKIHQYTLILDKAGILYRESAFDITQDIVTGLNAEYEAAKEKK